MSTASRQGLSPLQLEYQQLLAKATQCATQRVRVHETGFSSAVVNTDALGLRYSYCNGRRFSVAERNGTTRLNLLVGGRWPWASAPVRMNTRSPRSSRC